MLGTATYIWVLLITGGIFGSALLVFGIWKLYRLFSDLLDMWFEGLSHITH